MDLTPEERAMRARVAVHTSWAHTVDRAARTAPARDAAFARYERQVDPDGVLPPDVRRQRAEHARKADMQRLAMKSAQARRKRKAA